MTAIQRVKQGILALRAHPEPDEQAAVRRWLTTAQQEAFSHLPTHDRAHLVRVSRTLIESGETNPDVVVAGLLHDIGKVDGRYRVRLIDRTAKVLLRQLSPRLLARLASRARPAPLCGGLMLAVHHPEIGSERARILGCTERVCWLIKNHDNQALADPDLRRLIDVDRSTP
jgi:HD superfamily phosphodiesterase